jgi:hypothetical protein
MHTIVRPLPGFSGPGGKQKRSRRRIRTGSLEKFLVVITREKDLSDIFIPVERKQHRNISSGETMKTQQKSGHGLICLVLLLTIATLAVAGCTESASEHQGQMTAPGEKQSENATVKTTITIRTTSATVQPPAAHPAPDPVPPGDAIIFDRIGEKKTGDFLLITGTTGLPAGTNLFWQIRQDTGTPPAGVDMSSRMGIMANNQVIKGAGSSNQVALAVDAKNTKDLVAGKYVILAVSLKGETKTVDPTTGKLAGYTYLTLI